MLSSLLAILVPTGFVSGIVQLLLIPGFLPTFAVMCGALFALALAYGASRTRYFHLGGIIACLAPMAACAAIGVRHPDDRVWWAFMEIGVLLATILLSTAWAAVIGSLSIASVFAIVALVPDYGVHSTWLPGVAFQAVFSPLVVLVGHHRGRIEREREQALRLLEASRRLETIGRLAGGLAHDFNNVLMVIGSNADMLAHRLKQKHAELSDIRDAVDRAQALTRQLLTYARQRKLTPQLIELDDMLGGMRRFLTHLAGDVELKLETEAGGSRVMADASQLEQVLANLTLNARDAMPSGGELTIRTEALDLVRPQDGVPAGHFVMLSVSDTGVGMTPEVRERAFDPFFTTKGPDHGTGLGLATVHAIVAQAGGAITLESEPGRGTTVRVFWPRAEDPAEVASPALVANSSGP